VNTQLYVNAPPLGFVEPLPSNVTVLLKATVWFGPAFAVGAAAVVVNDHCSMEKSKGGLAARFTSRVIVLVLVA
jgi:hypothetical protein